MGFARKRHLATSVSFCKTTVRGVSHKDTCSERCFLRGYHCWPTGWICATVPKNTSCNSKIHAFYGLEHILTFQRHWFAGSWLLQCGLSAPSGDYQLTMITMLAKESKLSLGRQQSLNFFIVCMSTGLREGYCPHFTYWDQVVCPVATEGRVTSRKEVSQVLSELPSHWTAFCQKHTGRIWSRWTLKGKELLSLTDGWSIYGQ